MKRPDQKDNSEDGELQGFVRRMPWERYGFPGLYEIGQLGLGWLLICFVICIRYLFADPTILTSFFTTLNPAVIPLDIFAIMIAIGVAFIGHELSHKFAAQKYGGKAEFRLIPNGVIFTLIAAAIGFLVITPGAVFWSREGGAGVGIRGRVSAAGPISNLLFAGGFMIMIFFVPFLNAFIPFFGHLIALTAFYGTIINLALGIFNMLPIALCGTVAFDGSKIVDWDARIWIVLMGLFFVLGSFAFIGPIIASIFAMSFPL